MILYSELVETLPLLIKIKLAILCKLKERSDYHPEGNTAKHIRIVTERCIKTKDKDLIMTGLFHDICKFDAAKIIKENNFNNKESFFEKMKNGELKTYGHEMMAAKFIENYKNFIINFGADFQNVKFLVSQHMRIKQINKMKKAKQDVLKSHPLYNKLLLFSKADNMLNEFIV